MKSRFVLAIDGPAGAGKSSVSSEVAKQLGLARIDTGAMYRSVARAALERGVGLDDAAACADVARSLKFQYAGTPLELHVDGSRVGAEIRTLEVGQAASKVSVYAAVRTTLVRAQQEMGREGRVLLEGRDIGTVVFPDADLKIFLTASSRVRAQRRFDELAAQGGSPDFAVVLREVEERDARDQGRATAPLVAAKDALVVDSSELTLAQAVAQIVAEAEKRMRVSIAPNSIS